MSHGHNANSREPHACVQGTHNTAANETKVLVGVAGKINLYGYVIENGHSAQTYLQLFDAAAVGDVTLGTTTPDLTVAIPPVALGIMPTIPPLRALKHFKNGLVYAVTATRTGNGAPGAASALTLYFSQS